MVFASLMALAVFSKVSCFFVKARSCKNVGRWSLLDFKCLYLFVEHFNLNVHDLLIKRNLN